MAFEFEDKDVKLFQKFSGLRNNIGAESFEPSDLAEALNVDITDAFRIQRRSGFGTILSGAYHSMWSNGTVCLVMSAGTLYQYNTDNTVTAVRTGLSPQERMSYTGLADVVYFTNGIDTGAFAGGAAREWGIRPPTHQPEAFQIGGTLRAGSYQYAMTFQRADGAESGTGVAGTITVENNSGIGFRNLPTSTDPNVTKRNLYISPFDGDMLFRQAQLGTAETVATFMNDRIGSLPLNTQHLSPPLAGQIAAAYNGRTYIARGNRLYHSLPFAPELFDLRANFPFDSEITLVAPVDDGIYVGTTEDIMFLAGNGPEEFRVVNLTTYGVIPGTLAYTVAGDLVQDAKGLAAVFATTSGLCYGFNSGTFHNMTRDVFSYPAMDRGAGLVRKHKGMIQYITTLQGTEQPANAAD